MKSSISLLLLWATIVTSGRISKSPPFNEKIGESKYCGFNNYFPCSCWSNPGIHVNCIEVSAQDVYDVFQRVNETEITQLIWDLPGNDTGIVSLPEDFLGETTVEIIEIGSYSAHSTVVIDPLAFRASQNSAISIKLEDLDFSLQRDFDFLNGFDKLEKLWIRNVIHFTAFQYLPPLPSLVELDLYRCFGLNDIPFPDTSPAKLHVISVLDSFLNDKTADDMVAKLVTTSANSLFNMYLWSNNLTKIPNQLDTAFPAMIRLDLYKNNISYLPSSSFASAYLLRDLNLGFNRLTTIESGALQGNLTVNIFRQVNLEGNELDLFEEDVYKEVLTQIRLHPYGFLKLAGNRFVCGCDIAWLIRDHRLLLPVVIDGQCASDSPFPSVPFGDLDPELFAHCALNETEKMNY